ncbi:MAG: 50S ribosomal protein L24 [Eggerthellaceae bacterium]
MNIKKGDKVVVISGKDKGVESTVIAAYPREGRVKVEKVNVVTKAIHPSATNTQGGLTKIEAPIDVSNVMLICPSCGKPTRVGHTFEDGKKYRACKKCGAAIK